MAHQMEIHGTLSASLTVTGRETQPIIEGYLGTANHRSVSGYIIYVHGVPIVWRSAMQKVVSLSSTEAEWYSLSEAVKDVVFLISLCKSLQLQARLQVMVHVIIPA